MELKDNAGLNYFQLEIHLFQDIVNMFCFHFIYSYLYVNYV